MTTTVEPQAVPATGRVQLALNVENLDAAISFYERLFGVAPAKVKPGYANFAVDAPPLKLVLIEAEAGGTINHLGVEVPSTEQVGEASDRFGLVGLETREEDGVACCYAMQDKVWVTAPDGEAWEVYTVLGEAERMESSNCC